MPSSRTHAGSKETGSSREKGNKRLVKLEDQEVKAKRGLKRYDYKPPTPVP